jgi:hypothetical protein
MRMKSVLLLLLLAACHNETKAKAVSRSVAPKPIAAPAAPQIVVTTAGGDPAVQITQSGSDLSITYNDGGSNQTLVGRVKDSGKRKYALNGSVIYEVKRSDEGFKLRTEDGKLLWKVKKKDDKIKISDNEENKNPFELKIRDEKIKVVDATDKLLGEVKADAGGVKIVDAAGNAKYRSSILKAAPYFGVAVIDAIPARERAIIMAELASGQ